jgi:Rps23 Pro-64 3,4-dihydroxylase Tpa1-like proline 4-hydroxylase
MQQRYAGLVEARAKERRFELLDPVFARIFAELQAPEFIAFVERVTGVSGLQSDATFSGAGLHQVRDGGYHNVHADANIHPATGNFQRVNMLLYLNERWEPAWGGELELWDASMSRCETRIAPAFNRCLLIEVHDRAYHGYPRLHLPSGITRKSLTCWYYSKEPHALQSRVSHPVAFQVRPTDTLGARAKHHLRRALSAVRSRLPHR